LVIDWTTIGALPPTVTPPTFTGTDLLRCSIANILSQSQYHTKITRLKP